jgi:nucleolar protein 56
VLHKGEFRGENPARASVARAPGSPTLGWSRVSSLQILLLLALLRRKVFENLFFEAPISAYPLQRETLSASTSRQVSPHTKASSHSCDSERRTRIIIIIQVVITHTTTMADFLLHEGPMGYSLFKTVHQTDTVGNRLKEVQESQQDLAKFGKMVQLVSFLPFENGKQALEEMHDVWAEFREYTSVLIVAQISEGIASQFLVSFLELNLPKAGKGKTSLGVSDKILAGNIKSSFPKIECETGETSEIVADMLRGLRLHSDKLLKQLREGDTNTAQLGLGHAYSRAKVKFSVQKNDNHIIQAIAILDQLDKAINTFSMRVREWYSWHFPELVKIVSDNHRFAKCALFIKDKTTLSEDSLHDLAALVEDDEDTARAVINAAKTSMGQAISEADMENVMLFATRVVSLADYRKSLYSYLVSKMGVVAPNLAALIGEVVGARLISHAGSLTNLSKYPASTVQILGAEKALFRALKTKGNTPKYGLLYHSSFIGRAAMKNKGRISRFLANKCSIASRIDNFSEGTPNTIYGQALKAQVEERLDFYSSGTQPTKNETAMKNAMDAVLAKVEIDGNDSDEEMAGVAPRAVQKQEKQKKDKKKEKKHKSEDEPVKEKKRKHSELNGEVEGEKKKKKKKKSTAD